MKNNKEFVPHTSISQARSGVFLPSKFISSGKKESSWRFECREGDFFIRNQVLTQSHRALIDIMLAFFVQQREANGSVWCVFSAYELTNELGLDGKNSQPVRKLISEIFDAQLAWKIGGANASSGHGRIIEMHGWVDTLDDENLSSLKNQVGTSKYFVRFSREYMRLIESDMQVFYPDLLSSIFKIKHAPTQALIRYCLSQRDYVNESLKSICERIGLTEAFYPRSRISAEKNKIIANIVGERVKTIGEDGKVSITFLEPQHDMEKLFGISLKFKNENDVWPTVVYNSSVIAPDAVKFKAGENYVNGEKGERKSLISKLDAEQDKEFDRVLRQQSQRDMF